MYNYTMQPFAANKNLEVTGTLNRTWTHTATTVPYLLWGQTVQYITLCIHLLTQKSKDSVIRRVIWVPEHVSLIWDQCHSIFAKLSLILSKWGWGLCTYVYAYTHLCHTWAGTHVHIHIHNVRHEGQKFSVLIRRVRAHTHTHTAFSVHATAAHTKDKIFRLMHTVSKGKLCLLMTVT